MDNKHTQELSKIDLILDTVLHRGRSSMVYRCHTKENKKLLVCVKAKSISQTENYEKEARLLEKLKGIAPSLHFVHRVGDDEFIAMHYMGLSLHDLFEESGRKFSLRTLALIGLKTIVLLEALHNEGYIHGRLTPKKILTDRDLNKTLLYLVGLSDVKKFKTDKGEHIRYKESQSPSQVGSEFASLNSHAGIRLSRRDDIESLIYILLHFETRGEIFDQKSKSWEYKDLYKWKLETPAELMHPKVSIELVQLLNYARGLKFEERPNYEKIQKLFKNLLLKDLGKQQPDQARFDWCNKSDNSANVQVTDKRKVLHNLLQGEKVNRFPTIVEDPCEYLETKEAEQFGNELQVAEDGEFTFSPSYKPSYNSLQLTPKLDSQQQPALKSRMKTIQESDPSNVQSPWNCSENSDDLATIIDKVKSLEFVTSLRLNTGDPGK